MSKKPAISVVIPTYNRDDALTNTIKDILTKQTFSNFELIVIDQSKKHTQSTNKFIASIDDERFRYYLVSPPSVTMAKNFALNLARAQYTVFLDDDIKADKELLKAIMDTFEEIPGLHAVAGRVLQKGFPIKKDVLRFDKFTISHGVFTATKAAYTNAFPGGNCAVKTSVALKLGGFDTRYKENSFREENDLSMRIVNNGGKIYYQPKAKITHLAVPYGGNRISTHIYDNLGFYKNELFFTLRFTNLNNRPKALYKKCREYCVNDDRRIIKKRIIFFLIGLIAATYRILFVKQRKAQIIKI